MLIKRKVKELAVDPNALSVTAVEPRYNGPATN